MSAGHSAIRHLLRLIGLVSTVGSLSGTPPPGTEKRSCNALPKPAARDSLCPSQWAIVLWEASDRPSRPAPPQQQSDSLVILYPQTVHCGRCARGWTRGPASAIRGAAGIAHMSDVWLDLLRLCVMGAVGLGGAWLGAQATRRRERWSHRREVYQPILLSLMDLYIHSRHRIRLEEESDSADPKYRVRLNETIERAAAAMTEVQRVSAIALVLGDNVRAALDELGTEWLNATHQHTGRAEADARYAAVQKARRIVEATAKRHLRL